MVLTHTDRGARVCWKGEGSGVPGEVSELSKVEHRRTSLVVQWIRICLPSRGTQVPSLVREDSIRRGAAEPRLLSPSPRVCEWQLLKPECPGACAPQQERPRNEKPTHRSWGGACTKLLHKAETRHSRKRKSGTHRPLLLALHCRSICLPPPARLLFFLFLKMYYYFFAVRSGWLSILNTVVCTYQPQIPNLCPNPLPSPAGNHKFFLYVSESVFVL